MDIVEKLKKRRAELSTASLAGNLDRPHASVKGTIDVTVSCRGELPVTCKQLSDGARVGILSVMEHP